MPSLVLVEIAPGGRLRMMVRQNDGQMVQVSSDDQVLNQDIDKRTATLNLTSQFKISNYHFSDDYRVSTTNGIVAREADLISYTPSELGAGGFWLNGTFIAIEVIPDQPRAPMLLNPQNGETEVSIGVAMVVDAFSAPNPSMQHVKTQWQIARDAEFTDIVMDVTTATDLLSINATGLIPEQMYYARARFIGETGV